MIRRRLFHIGVPVLMATAPGLAQADITSKDVWSNMQAAARAVGGALSGTLTQTDEITTVEDPRLDFTLPAGVGKVSIELSGYAMIENPDGSVTLLYTDNLTYRVQAIGTGQNEGFVMEADLSLPDARFSAAGTPGDVTYTSEFADMSVIASIFGADLPDTGSISMSASGGRTRAVTRITEGELLTVSGSTASGPSSFEMTMDFGADAVANTQGTMQAVSGDYTMTLLPEGVTPLNLAPAFAAGMAFQLSTIAGGSDFTTVTTLATGESTSETRRAGPSSAKLGLDKDALSLIADFSDSSVEMTNDMMQGLAGKLAFEAASGAIDLLLPISGKPDPQDTHLRFHANGLRMSPNIWAQFDPEKQIPRTLADVAFDVSATVLNLVDLTNFALLGSAKQADLPIPELKSVSVNQLSLSAAGASATANGSFDFEGVDLARLDMTDKWPVGTGEVTATGVQALLDTLLRIGIMSDDQAMGLRMGLSMFFEVTGEDQIRSGMESTAEGQVYVNGQRMR